MGKAIGILEFFNASLADHSLRRRRADVIKICLNGCRISMEISND
jgi:hypothetical protein